MVKDLCLEECFCGHFEPSGIYLANVDAEQCKTCKNWMSGIRAVYLGLVDPVPGPLLPPDVLEARAHEVYLGRLKGKYGR